jgi:single-strand DNA-binding protein
MAEINSVVLVGRLTRDAEMKYTQGGAAIVKFALAINRRKKVGESWQDEANYFDVTMMGKSGEAVHKYLVKGKMVGVQGELRQNRWEQDGQTRSKVEIFAFSLQLLGDSRGGTSQSAPEPAASNYGGFSQASDEQFEDDIPF